MITHSIRQKSGLFSLTYWCQSGFENKDNQGQSPQPHSGIDETNGLEIDDRAIIDKLKAFDKSTMFSEGKDLVSGIKTVYSLVSEVAKLAA